MLQDVFHEVFDEHASTYPFIIFTYTRFTLHLPMSHAEKRNFNWNIQFASFISLVRVVERLTFIVNSALNYLERLWIT
jgi:hypothetical protein